MCQNICYGAPEICLLLLCQYWDCKQLLPLIAFFFFFAWVVRRELRSLCLYDNLFTCRASPIWFYLSFNHIYGFGDTKSTLDFKNHHSAYHRGSWKVDSMTAIMKLGRLCGYALVWNVNLIVCSPLSPNTRCLIKLWIEILNIWIYLRLWSRSLRLGMYAFRTRFTFIVLRFSSFLLEIYKIYDTIDSIIQFSWIKWLFKCRFGILKGE